MATSSVLAKQYIEFATKGLEEVTANMERVKRGLENIEAIGNRAKTMFLGITGTIGGFVTAGLMGTTQANRMQIQMQLLSREIAGIFAPLIEQVIGKLQGLVDWFKGLSGAQQESIRHWVLIAAGVTGFLALLPKIIGGFMAMKAAAAALGIALGISTGGLTWILGGLVTLFVTFKALNIEEVFKKIGESVKDTATSIAKMTADITGLTEVADEFKKQTGRDLFADIRARAEQAFLPPGMRPGDRPEEKKQRTAVTQAGGNFEGVQETFRRIQANVVKQAGPEQKQAADIGKIAEVAGRAFGFFEQQFGKLINAQPLGA